MADISTQAQSLDGVGDGLVKLALSELDGSDFESVRDHSATLRATITRLTAENAAQAAEIERLRETLKSAHHFVSARVRNAVKDAYGLPFPAPSADVLTSKIESALTGRQP